MKLVCSYCGIELGTKEPLEDDRISHSMCEACFEHFDKQWGGQRLGEYLDQFDLPVLAVDGDRRVVAANQAMAEFLGKSEREIFGLLGGEAIECVHSRLPEGCGQTVHCKACAIRLTVQATLDTGAPKTRIPAYLTREQADKRLYISTELRDGAVIVTVEDAPEESAELTDSSTR